MTQTRARVANTGSAVERKSSNDECRSLTPEADKRIFKRLTFDMHVSSETEERLSSDMPDFEGMCNKQQWQFQYMLRQCYGLQTSRFSVVNDCKPGLQAGLNVVS